jgi:hypothetical protein
LGSGASFSDLELHSSNLKFIWFFPFGFRACGFGFVISLVQIQNPKPGPRMFGAKFEGAMKQQKGILLCAAAPWRTLRETAIKHQEPNHKNQIKFKSEINKSAITMGCRRSAIGYDTPPTSLLYTLISANHPPLHIPTFPHFHIFTFSHFPHSSHFPYFHTHYDYAERR